MASKHRILAYVAGLLYFYGAVTLDNLRLLVEERLCLDELDIEAFQALLDANVADERSPYVFAGAEACYYDIEVEDWKRILQAQEEHPELAFRPVSEADTSDLVRDHYTNVWSLGERRFFDWLSLRCGDDQALALPLMLDYAAELKNGRPALDVAKRVIRELELTAVEDVQEAAERVKDFAEATPQWILKGWSLKDV